MRAWVAGAALLTIAAPAQSAADLDRFAGYYQLKPDMVVRFTRSGDHLFAQGSGQPAIELRPEGVNRFGARQGHWRFEVNPAGRVTGAVLMQYGSESRAPRIGAAQSQAIAAAQQAQVKANKPSPETEAALRRQIVAFGKGVPDYAALAPPLASVIRKNAQLAIDLVRKQGALKSLTFRNVLPGGANVYDAQFAHGDMEWVIAPLTPDGKIDHLAFKPL